MLLYLVFVHEFLYPSINIYKIHINETERRTKFQNFLFRGFICLFKRGKHRIYTDAKVDFALWTLSTNIEF